MRFASLAERAQNLDGFARTLEPVSEASRYKLEMDITDDVVKMTVDGGAWISLFSVAGPVVTLQEVYDGGGAIGSGLGRSATTLSSGAFVMTNSAANNNSVLELNKTPVGAQTGAVLAVVNTPGALAAAVGATVTMGSLTSSAGYAARLDWRGLAGTAAGNGVLNVIDTGLAGNLTGPLTGIMVDVSSAFHNGQAVQGMSIIGPATTAAAATKQGMLVIQGRHSLMRGISMSVRNKQAGTDGLVYIEWDTTNFEGAVASSILTGETNMVVLNGQANVDALTNNVLFRGAWLLVPATTNVTTRGVFVDSLQRGGSVFEAAVSPGAAAAVNGFLATMGANTTGAGFSASVTNASGVAFQAALAPLATNATVGFDYDRTGAPTGATTYTGNAINIQNTPTGTNNYSESSTGLVTINHAPVAGAGTITDTTTGLSITITPAGASAVTGAAITMSTLATGAGLLITHNRATAAAGTVALRLTGADESVCLEMSDGDTVGVSAASEGRLVYNATTQAWQVSSNTSAYSNLLTVATTSLQLAYNGGAPVVVTVGNPVTIANAAGVTSNLLGLTDLTTAANANYGITYTRAPVPAGAFTGGAISIQNTPGNTAQNETGVLILVNHTSGALSTDTTTGLGITMTPGVASAVKGQTITMGTLTSSAGYAATFSSAGTAGEAVGNGIVNVTKTGVTTAQSVGLEIDMTGISAGGLAYPAIGQRILIPATITAVEAPLQAAFVIDSQATLARVIDCAVANTSAATGLWVLRYRAATTFAAAVTGVSIDLDPTTSAGNQAVSGLKIVLDGGGVAGTDPSSASYCANFDYRSVNGTAAGNGIVNIGVGEARTLAGQLVGLECDLTTNVTAGTQTVIGMRTLIPGVAGSNASIGWSYSRSGAPVIESTYTGNGILISNTPTGTSNCTENGVLLSITHTPTAGAGTITDTTTGLAVAMTPAYAASDVRGVLVTMGAFTGVNGYAATFDWRGTAGTAAANGILNVEIGANTTLAGPLTGIECDMKSNLVPGTQTVTGMRTLISSGAGSNASIGFSYIRAGAATATGVYSGSAIDIQNTPTGPTGGLTLTETSILLKILHQPVLGAGAIADATVGQYIDMIPAASGSPVIQGLVVRLGANSTSSSAIVSTANNTAIQIPHFRMTDVSSGAGIQVYVGSGVPAHTSGVNNGDMYWNVTGGALTSIYKRIAGVWTAIA